MRCITYTICLVLVISFFSAESFAQKSTSVNGTVRNRVTKEFLPAVSVTLKGSSMGTFTDEKGNFSFSSEAGKFPFTLVFSSVGFVDKEVLVSTETASLNVELEPGFALGQEIVVAASRAPERILESPVTIERVNSADIQNAPATNYYDLLGNLKGVDMITSSMTFKTVSTRGFNTSGNLRLNQLMDGMDNQAPGLNFAVGSIIGLTELDVDNMELLSGASSALYGPGGMNGTLLITSKNPFKSQGLSFQVKQGIMHVDSYERKPAPYYDWSMRWGKKISEKFAFKIGAQFIHAKDWVARDYHNYNRTTSAKPYGELKGGTRESDPNYDGVNVYGDETTQGMSSIASSVRAAVGAQGVGAIDGIINANPTITLEQLIGAIGGPTSPLAPYAPIIYGSNANKNYFGSQDVSRTGYNETDVIDPTTFNFKASAGLYYKITPKIEASLSGYWGTGNTVYTASDRYSLKKLKMGQYKLEFKHDNWFARAYTTQEDAGESFNSTITTRLFNEAWKPSSQWYPEYLAAYASARDAGAPDAHLRARAFADQGRPTGFIGNNDLFQKVAGTPISKGGGLFVDKTSLYMIEGQYNFTKALGLAKSGTDILAGGNWKQYVLNSEGTLFADTAGKIRINELGAYLQVSQKLFKDVLKITASGRYDKNTNFDGRFTPRVSGVVELAKDHHVRLSYQQAYRFPSTQNQWINLFVSSGARLMGGLKQLRDHYHFDTNPAYTLASVRAFGAALQSGTPPAEAAGLLKVQEFGDFKAETSSSYEIGYKGLIQKKLLIDVYAYLASYENFISSTTVIQSKAGPGAPFDLLDASNTKRTPYNISVNAPGKVKTNGWGVSVDYLLPSNFVLNANVFSDKITDIPDGFVSQFNTPEYRFNIGIGNTGFLYQKRFGFNLIYRWQDKFFYESSFGQGEVAAYSTLDALINYKFPQIKSMVKLGATNVLNKYYISGFGNPSIGGLYYVSFAYNVF